MFRPLRVTGCVEDDYLETLLLRYVLQKGRVRYLRLRNVEIQRDKRSASLIDLIGHH
jgi:hypothetical protein